MMNAGWAEEEEEAAAPSPGSIPAAGPRTAVDIVVGAGLAFLRAGCCTVLSGCSGGDAVVQTHPYDTYRHDTLDDISHDESK